MNILTDNTSLSLENALKNEPWMIKYHSENMIRKCKIAKAERKVFWMCYGIALVILMNSVQEAISNACAKRDYGNKTIVCVCNATYCDTIPKVTKGELLSGTYISFTSSKNGLRLQRNLGTFTKHIHNEYNKTQPLSYLEVNASIQYQEIMGFGAALTDAVGFNLVSLSKESQRNLLRSYFSDEGIEYTQIRIPMSGSDYSLHEYTYDDIENDFNLKHFNLTKEDYVYKIPFLHTIKGMSARPIQFQATAWTAPEWMKTRGKILKYQSQLKEDYYQLWADYYVRFLEEYNKTGLQFWGITAQNQPSVGYIFNFPIISMGWSPAQQSKWIGDFLLPTLRRNGYGYMKILAVDDSISSLPWWPYEVFENKKVDNNVQGIAIHWYLDNIAPASLLLDITHLLFPEKFILYNEACLGKLPIHNPRVLGSWYAGEFYIESIFKVLNHWVSGWMEWNMALDLTGGPSYLENYSDAAIIVNATGDEFYKQPMFYTLAHFSKFVPPGSRRIQLKIKSYEELLSIAFLTPEDIIVIILYNKGLNNITAELNEPNHGLTELVIEEKSLVTLLYSRPAEYDNSKGSMSHRNTRIHHVLSFAAFSLLQWNTGWS